MFEASSRETARAKGECEKCEKGRLLRQICFPAIRGAVPPYQQIDQQKASWYVPAHSTTTCRRPHVGTDCTRSEHWHRGPRVRRHKRGQRAALSADADGGACDLDVGARGVCARVVEEGGADAEVGVGAVSAGFGCDGVEGERVEFVGGEGEEV